MSHIFIFAVIGINRYKHGYGHRCGYKRHRHRIGTGTVFGRYRGICVDTDIDINICKYTVIVIDTGIY